MKKKLEEPKTKPEPEKMIFFRHSEVPEKGL